MQYRMGCDRGVWCVSREGRRDAATRLHAVFQQNPSVEDEIQPAQSSPINVRTLADSDAKCEISMVRLRLL